MTAAPRPGAPVIVTRPVQDDDPHNHLGRHADTGEVFYRSAVPDFGCIDTEAGIALTEHQGKPPAFEFPADAITTPQDWQLDLAGALADAQRKQATTRQAAASMRAESAELAQALDTAAVQMAQAAGQLAITARDVRDAARSLHQVLAPPEPACLDDYARRASLAGPVLCGAGERLTDAKYRKEGPVLYFHDDKLCQHPGDVQFPIGGQA